MTQSQEGKKTKTIMEEERAFCKLGDFSMTILLRISRSGTFQRNPSLFLTVYLINKTIGSNFYFQKPKPIYC